MKKIISFSLYGQNEKYSIGLICNIELSSLIYPGWICRVYYDETVPTEIINKLTEYKNIELYFVNKEENNLNPRVWRFLPIDDDDVEIMISRDADSRLSKREKVCVDIFEQSDFLVHSIRDNNSHNDMMAGMWGIKKNGRIKIKDLLIKFNSDEYDFDQKFLREDFIPYFSDSCLTHCSTFLNNFPVEKENEYFVGGWWDANNFGKPYNYIFF